MDRGNINFMDNPPVELKRSYFFLDVIISFRQRSGEGQSEAGCRLLQKDPQSRQPGCERVWRQAGVMFLKICFPFCASPEIFSHPSSVSHLKSFLFSLFYCNLFFPLPPLLPWQLLPIKEHLLIPFPLSLPLSVLPSEVGGLSEKIGSLFSKADRQPHDPGAKGELSTRPF